MATQQDVIQKFIQSLITSSNKNRFGEESLNKAVRDSTPYFKAFQNTGGEKNIKDSFINDLRNSSVEDFLRVYCGINFNTSDNGAIIGSDAGGSSAKTEANLIPETSSLIQVFKADPSLQTV